MSKNLTTAAGATLAALTIALSAEVTSNRLAEAHLSDDALPNDCLVTAEPSENALEAPTNLTTSNGPQHGQVVINWTDNSESETCFVLEIKLGGFVADPFETHTILGANITTFLDGPYEEGTLAAYRVYAANASAQSEYSNVADIVILHLDSASPTPPTTPRPSFVRGDLNCDGSIDPVDSLILLRYDAGLGTNLPPGCPPLDATASAAGPAAIGTATEETPPGDCYVASEPTGIGPIAPGDLEAEVAPGGPPAFINLSWSDNSDNETCFVIEARFSGGVDDPYEPLAFVEAGVSTFVDGPYSGGTIIFYRIYAANESSRSEYSNVVGVGTPLVEPPTPPPVYFRGDLNCDGTIDPIDAFVVLTEDAGLDPGLPPDCPPLKSTIFVLSAGIAAIGISAMALATAFVVTRRLS